MRVRCPECDVTLRVSADDADRKIECPECGERFRPRPVRDDDDDDRPRRKGKPAKKKAGGTSVGTLVGGGIAGLAAIGAIAWVVNGQINRPVQKPADPPAVAENNGPAQVPAQNLPGPNAEEIALQNLFAQPVNAPLPTRKLVKMEKAGENDPPLEVAAFTPPQPPADGPKLTGDEVKAATAYIKVGDADRLSTGSGFYVGTVGKSGLVATNRHVVDSALLKAIDPTAKPPGITVVFNSNVPGKEVSVPATIVAIHPDADLAVLKVPGDKLPAKPIDPFAAPPVTDNMPVDIYGFPLGANLGVAGANPNISISPGSVSSLRTDKDGKLDQVQITGPLIPGNSGGPIVDKNGRLAGVAVSTLQGLGIGFAVPVNDLVSLLGGMVRPARVVPHALDGKAATFKVVVPVIDPMAKVKAVRLLYRVGGKPPAAEKDGATGYKLLADAGRVDLTLADAAGRKRAASGELVLPADARGVVVQVVAESAAGPTAASPPVAFTLAAGDVPEGRDAGKFAEFASQLRSNPAALAGQVRVVRGKIVGKPESRAPYQDIGVVGPDGKPLDNVKFMADRETSAQFDEVDDDDDDREARITCVVGPRWQDGQVPVRVARVDFLDEDDRPVRSIPAGDGKDDALALLNRDPERFVNQSLDVTGKALLLFGRQGGPKDAFLFFFPHLKTPRNLRFVTAPSLTERLADGRAGSFRLERVRLAVSVSPRKDKYVPATVTIRKIEILDDKDDRVLRTLE